MKFRKTMIAVMCAASLGAVSVPFAASAAIEIFFNAAPPAPRFERVPKARRGYTWSPGYWNMNGKRHVWKAGHWERDRKGYYRTAPAWTQRGDRWQLERGRWNRGDRDRDGVPNSVDRAPDNPNRR